LSALWPLALACAVACTPAQGHDTWFSAQSGTRAGEWQLRLGTGDRFPHQTFTVPPAALKQQGCRQGQAAAVATQPQRMTPTALLLKARLPAGAVRGNPSVVTCFAELQAVDIAIEPALVEVYLQEIAAPAAVRAAWQAQQARGVPWQERYRKSARVELRDPRLGGGDAPPAAPAPMAMDIVPERGPGAWQVGEEMRFQVLRDGQPLAGQAIEARSSLSPLGLWVRTDAQGRAAVRLPLPGAWLLRGTELRPSTQRPDQWESDFVTLAFDVAPRPR
jgi:hypothetical protein